MKIQLIETEEGEQIVLFPAGFEMAADEVQLTKEGDRVIAAAIRPDSSTDRES